MSLGPSRGLFRGCALFCGLVCLAGAAAASELRGQSLARAVPSGAVAYVEADGLGDLLERIGHAPLVDKLRNRPQYGELQKNPGFRKAMAARQILETQFGMDVWTASRTLLGGQVAAAFYPVPDRKEPDALLLVRGADAEALARLRKRLEPFLVLAEERVQRENMGPIEFLAVDQKLYFAVGPSWLVLASSADLARVGAARLQGEAGASLADDESFRQMTEQMGDRHLVCAYVNTRMISQAAGGRFVSQKLDNPLVSLLIGGTMELAANSPYAGLTVDVDEVGFTATAGIAGHVQDLDAAHRVYFSPADGPGAPRLPRVPQLIGGFSLYRDIGGWYRHREELLQEQLLPGFDKFESGIGNLLPGRDFGTDVLPLVGSRLSFLAARQDYAHLEGQPGIKLPGFGVIIELARPDEGEEVFRLFFQTLTTVLNLQAGQQGRQPWVIKSQTHNGVAISYGDYLQKPKGSQLPVVFNFMPASARVGDQFVMTSSLDLCRHAIDALKAGRTTDARGPSGKSAAASAGSPESPPIRSQPAVRASSGDEPAGGSETPAEERCNFNLEIYSHPLAAALEANRELLVARGVQGGRSPEEAHSDLSFLLDLVKSVQTLTLREQVRPGAYQIRLQGVWK